MFAPATDQLAVVASTAPLCTGPYAHQVIIASTSQVSPIRGPLQAAHFLCVSSQGADVMVCHPHIMVVDVSRSGATAGGGERGEHTHFSAKMENTREISPLSLIGETFLPGDNMVIPAQTSNPCCVAGHAAQALLIFNIPQLNGNQYNLSKNIYKTHVLICPIFIWTQVAR